MDRATLDASDEASESRPTLTPSRWVMRFSHLVRAGGHVLDLAAGGGRHTQWFLASECSVLALDRDLSALAWLEHPRLEKVEADLEGSEGWPLHDRTFDAVVVTNYLWRSIFDDLVGAVRHDGVLIYETFAEGNERYGRPRRPEFLLQPGELLAKVAPRLEVVAFEQGYSDEPSERVVQRICAIGRGRRLSQCPLGTSSRVDRATIEKPWRGRLSGLGQKADRRLHKRENGTLRDRDAFKSAPI